MVSKVLAQKQLWKGAELIKLQVQLAESEQHEYSLHFYLK